MSDEPSGFAAVSSDGMIAVEWQPAADGDRDCWIVWEGDHPGWLGPQPYRWRDNLIQRATLVYPEYDTSKTADQVLREFIKNHNSKPWHARKQYRL